MAVVVCLWRAMAASLALLAVTLLTPVNSAQSRHRDISEPKHLSYFRVTSISILSLTYLNSLFHTDDEVALNRGVQRILIYLGRKIL